MRGGGSPKKAKLSDTEKKAKKAEYMRQYLARRKYGKEAKDVKKAVDGEFKKRFGRKPKSEESLAVPKAECIDCGKEFKPSQLIDREHSDGSKERVCLECFNA